jgi:hypothetical protein
MKSRKRRLGSATKKVSEKRGARQSARHSRNTKRADALEKTRQKFKETRQKVDEFARTHPGFDKLAKEIIFWIEKRLNLDDAYRVAKVLDKVNVKLGRAEPS